MSASSARKEVPARHFTCDDPEYDWAIAQHEKLMLSRAEYLARQYHPDPDGNYHFMMAFERVFLEPWRRRKEMH